MSEGLRPRSATGLWDNALLAPVSELNEQMLDILRQMAASAAPGTSNVPRLVTLLREQWCTLDSAAQRRLAACPYLLLDAAFARPDRWERLPVLGVGDGAARCGYFCSRGGVALVRRALMFAWHLARSDWVAGRVIVGMSPAAADRIACCRLEQLEMLAELSPSWIAPRWEQQANVWQQLISAARQENPTALRQTQLRGLQLLAAGVSGRTADVS